jgi:hypothetical protein
MNAKDLQEQINTAFGAIRECKFRIDSVAYSGSKKYYVGLLPRLNKDLHKLHKHSTNPIVRLRAEYHLIECPDCQMLVQPALLKCIVENWTGVSQAALRASLDKIKICHY